VRPAGFCIGKTEFGASFPFPLAPAEVGSLNGHRPFSLRGWNVSKCPIADPSLRLVWPALAFGKSVDQQVNKRAHLGAQVPAMRIERIDLKLLRSIARQQRHQRT